MLNRRGTDLGGTKNCIQIAAHSYPESIGIGVDLQRREVEPVNKHRKFANRSVGIAGAFCS